MVDIVNGLYGHNYEYGTADYKLLVFYTYNKQNNYNIKGKKLEIRSESMKLIVLEWLSVSQE